jgi:ribosomal protein S18 acetylase RimI-like enzyme
VITLQSRCFDIREAAFRIVQPFAGRAAREHVSISETRDTRWFVGVLRDAPRDVPGEYAIAGVAGLLKFRSQLRIKGVWVAPTFRGRGLGNAFVEHFLAIAEDECAPSIEAFVANVSYYQGLGFRQTSTLPNGAVKMMKVL